MPGHSYTQNEGLRELVCRCCVILKTAKLEIVVSILFRTSWPLLKLLIRLEAGLLQSAPGELPRQNDKSAPPLGFLRQGAPGGRGRNVA